jgi:hypothetical protein
MAWRDEIGGLSAYRPYFDVSATPKGLPSHVLWLDLLGTKAALTTSVARATNFVMKLHAAILASKGAGSPHFFPMNDGAFLVHRDWEPIESLAREALRLLAITYVMEANPEHRFMVRGAIAFGCVSFGSTLLGNNQQLQGAYAQNFLRRVVLGQPLAAAFEAESAAPPFGVVVHPSAAATVHPQRDNLWRWFEHNAVESCVREGLGEVLIADLNAATYASAAKHLAVFQRMWSA